LIAQKIANGGWGCLADVADFVSRKDPSGGSASSVPADQAVADTVKTPTTVETERVDHGVAEHDADDEPLATVARIRRMQDEFRASLNRSREALAEAGDLLGALYAAADSFMAAGGFDGGRND